MKTILLNGRNIDPHIKGITKETQKIKRGLHSTGQLFY